ARSSGAKVSVVIGRIARKVRVEPSTAPPPHEIASGAVLAAANAAAERFSTLRRVSGVPARVGRGSGTVGLRGGSPGCGLPYLKLRTRVIARARRGRRVREVGDGASGARSRVARRELVADPFEQPLREAHALDLVGR